MADFENDLRNKTIQLLDSHGINYREKMDTHELLKRYYTFMQKYIVPAKRKVSLSEELIKSMPSMPILVQQAIERLTVWIADGIDINCYQSRGLYGHGSRDYQNALYGVVHLHLSAKKEDTVPRVRKDGFAKPSKYILYAYFTYDHAYLIKAETHPGNDDIEFIKWVNTELLEIIVKNWPELMEKKELKEFSLCDANGKPMQLDNNAIATLTKKHANVPLCVNNKLYMPGYVVVCRRVYDALVAQCEAVKAKLAKTKDRIAEKNGQRRKLEAYIQELREVDHLASFDKSLFTGMVDSIAVHAGQSRSDKTLVFQFRDGTKIPVEA